jgi:hypothetical protein
LKFQVIREQRKSGKRKEKREREKRKRKSKRKRERGRSEEKRRVVYFALHTSFKDLKTDTLVCKWHFKVKFVTSWIPTSWRSRTH